MTCPKRISRAEADPLFREYRRTRDVSVRNRIAEGFMGVVIIVATKVGERLGGHVEHDELIAFGMIGLLGAIEGYDPDHAASFTTYAPRRIRGAILDEIRKLDHVPRLTRSRARLVNDAEATFYAQHGRMPDANELRVATGLDGRAFANVAGDCRPRAIISAATPTIDDPTWGNREETIADTFAGRPDVEPGTAMDAEAIVRDVVLPNYGLRHAILLKCYYGEQQTLKVAAEALRISESRASQMHTNLMAALRGHFCAAEAA